MKRAWLCFFAFFAACESAPPAPAPTPSDAPPPAPAAAQEPAEPPRALDDPAALRRKARLAHTPPPPVRASTDPRSAEQIAIAACTDPAGVWRCKAPRPKVFAASTATPIFPKTWTVPAWFVDPSNVSGVASDDNACTTSGSPCLTFQEINVHRWGCLGNPSACPRLQQTTVLTFRSAPLNGLDPVLLQPSIENLAHFSVQGAAPTVVATGVSLSGTTAKNKAAGANTLLKTTLGASGAVNQLVENTTHPSRAWAYKSLGANAFSLSQPLTKMSVTQTTLPTEVDTWANADSVNLLTPISVNLVQLTPVISMFADGTTGTPSVSVYQLNIYDPTGVDVDPVFLGPSVILEEVSSDRTMVFTAGSLGATDVNFGDLESPACLNCDNKSALTSTAPINFYGGIASESVANIFSGGNNTNFGLDVIWSGFGWAFQSGVHSIYSAYLDCPVNVYAGLVKLTFSSIGGNRILWGAGTNTVVMNGSSHFQLSGSNFVTSFTAPGLVTGIQLAGLATACSHTNAAPDVTNCGITTTPLHLDAAAGVAGFGSNAFFPGGASVSNF